MPELPEVETVVNGIKQETQNSCIVSATTTRPNMRYPFPTGICQTIAGQAIVNVERRAKYILIHLSNNDTLIMHLGMSGRITFPSSQYTSIKHDHFIINLDNGKKLVLNDARRFGFVDIYKTDSISKSRHFKNMGYEPFDKKLNAKVFFSLLTSNKSNIKSFLLNQKYVVGIGNIYACEALFLSKIHPETTCNQLSLAQATNLLKHIRQILKSAIKAGGSTLRDYTTVDGSLGRFQFSFNVYGQENKKCLNKNCSDTIIRINQSGRSTFYCPSCQKNAYSMP